VTSLAILADADDAVEGANYLVGLLAEIWRREGVEVAIVRGADSFEPADGGFLHVDRTRVPGAFLRQLARYPVRINAATADIAKRAYSERLVRTPFGHRGPVIVKSDRNHGGVPERMKARGLAALLARAGDLLPWWASGRFAGNDYPIFASPWAVPPAAWVNPRLLVEKLMCERAGDLYVVRRWIFFGTREVNYAMAGTAPNVSRANWVGERAHSAVPEQLRAWRRRLGFDFGKFDYALVDGETVLYDANRTPNLRLFREAWFAPHLADLAQGLWDFLPRRS